MVKNTYFILMFIACLLTGATITLSDETCTNKDVAGDREIWNAYPYMTQQWYRDMVAQFYNMEKDEWDGGWGWAKYNNPDPHLYAFCKMMSAGKLLWSGLTNSLSLQGAWSAQVIPVGATGPYPAPPNPPPPYPQPSIVARNSFNIDCFFRNTAGNLLNENFTDSPWHPGSFSGPLSETRTDVSDLVKTEKSSYRIQSDPVALSRTSNTLDVFARSYGHDLFHFKFVTNPSIGPQWTAQNLTELNVRPEPVITSSRYWIYSKPVAISRTNSSMDVFAIDNYSHVIHYFWEQGSGWNAEDLTHICGDDFSIHDGLVVHRRNNTTMDVFGASSNDHLIHFSRSGMDGWSAEDITENRNSEYRVDGTPSAVSIGPNKDDLLVYMRSGYKLIMYAWLSAWETWWEWNISGTDYAVEGDPVAVARSVNSADAFIRDINGHLIQVSYAGPEGFSLRDLTRELADSYSYRLDSNPVVFTASPDRLDVFGSTQFGYLTHFFWTSQLGWDVQNIHFGPNISPILTIEGAPIVIQRHASALEVFAKRLSYSDRTVHFTAPIGLTVNSWHTNQEYSNWASGSLHDFDYVPKKTSDEDDYAEASDDQVTMMCSGLNCIPAERASTMLHEATHVIFWYFPHDENNRDPWFFHTLRNPLGGLGFILKNHSMWQIEVEYLTDIEEFPAFGIPLQAYNGSIDIANNMMNNYIQNPPPGWTPGVPRPLY